MTGKKRRPWPLLKGLAEGALITVFIMLGEFQLAALKSAADFTVGGRSGFAAFSKFLSNLGGELQPLAIPIAVICLIVGGLKIATGDKDGGTWIAGAFIGGGVVLLAPTLAA